MIGPGARSVSGYKMISAGSETKDELLDSLTACKYKILKILM